MMYRSPLVYLAPFASAALVVCAIVSFLYMFVSLGLPPCSEAGLGTQIARWAVPTSFVIAAAIVVRLMFKGGWQLVIFAIAIPVAAIVFYSITVPFEAARQTRCASQNWREAMASCKASPANYRLGRDGYGYPTLTLHAPGSTDRSWSCLTDWARRNSREFGGQFSINIHESVYAAARQGIGQPRATDAK
jgi:hypothetical protein